MSPFTRRARAVLVSLVLGVLVLTGIAACDARGGSLPSLGASQGATDGGRRPLARLDDDLRAAFVDARVEAAAVGIVLHVNSGWRSTSHQQRLFDDAVELYGSDEEAARWVARPGTSVHESGDAVDVGPEAGAEWLSGHGAAYGLCRIYDNEPWHFELRPDAATAGCPAAYADPTADPRMQ